MICCGCSLDVDGVWRVKQLNPHLQELIKKYPAEFSRSNKKSDAAEKQCAPHATNQSDTVIIARPKFKVWHGCITYVALYFAFAAQAVYVRVRKCDFEYDNRMYKIVFIILTNYLIS
ncbi:hypothetical protein JG688_00014633 [Phytophthora aleatoria]|uniref:Uncharacterized protein n=1 Tax=Phytophthora aleatoria TaxID=2496075 RepID=A0A8J5IKX1_9STRA|nr:hypothetical protein JG688_00014633 [Phytophthora aleatoria]